MESVIAQIASMILALMEVGQLQVTHHKEVNLYGRDTNKCI
jgi:hypothetical protein